MDENVTQPSSAASHRNSLQQPANLSKIRRRNRIITSCLECRRRKLKCDRSHPCNHCAKAARDCVFLSPALDSVSKGKLNQFKESIDHLEKGLEREAGDPGALEWNVASPSTQSSKRLPIGEPIPEDEQNLEPSPLAIADVAYDDDADDLIDDLGVRFGKVRITERVGGFVRPRIGEEVYERFREAKSPEFVAMREVASLDRIMSPPLSDPSSASKDISPEFMAPGASLLFPHTASDDVSLITFLPSRDFADRLVAQYWIAVHPVARVVHRPSFERQYSQFWSEIAEGFEPTPQLQALVFAALFSAAISLPAEAIERDFGCSRNDMIRTFRTGCEHALSRANAIRTTRAITLQALVMYLIPLCREEITRAQASIVSMALRLAECAGFHRDPTTFGMSPVDSHVRRLIWHQLLFLDIRTVEAVGARPAMRSEDYDTKLPLHVDDSELESLVPPRSDVARWTEMTIIRIRLEAADMVRTIWLQRPMLDKGQISLTALLKRVEDWREHAVKKYMSLIDKSIPIQNFAAKMMQMLYYKMHVNILHRYAVSVPQEMPERLMSLLWSSSTAFLEVGVELDSSPEFSAWSWYLGASQQWHVSLLLMFMISKFSPNRPEIERIWTCLDYIFELPPEMERIKKIDFAMVYTFHRLDEYLKHRKQRFPTSVDQTLTAIKSAESRGRAESVKSDKGDGLQSPFHPMGVWSNNTPGVSPGLQQRTSPPAPEIWAPAQATLQNNVGLPTNFNVQVPPGSSSDQQYLQSNAFQTSIQPDQTQNVPLTGFYSTAPPQQSHQSMPHLDMDELERLFPVDSDILGSFEPATAAQSCPDTSGIPAMTYLPDPHWIRNGSQGYRR